MVYWTPYPWYIEPPNNGISSPLPMVFWNPYPWYIKPPTHGISNPLPMIYRTPVYGILNPLPMAYRTPYSCCLCIRPINKKLSSLCISNVYFDTDMISSRVIWQEYHWSLFYLSFLYFDKKKNSLEIQLRYKVLK